jgi:two-component system LytT family response regulator
MNEILRAIIVDDEEPARHVMRQLLVAHPNVKLVGEASSASAAVELFMDVRPDVVFLDVQMPFGDGFSILPKLQPIPAIIFVTAYDEYAVRAFEVNAIDYLLKPVREERLSEALHRVIYLPRRTQTNRYQPEDRIFLESDASIRVVFVAEISGIDAEGNYSRVHITDGSSVFIRRSMAEWEALLPEILFVRVHRSLLLNHRAVEKIDLKDREHVVVHVRGFTAPLILTKRAFARLRKALRGSGLL